jgi:hypothetical protein
MIMKRRTAGGKIVPWRGKCPCHRAGVADQAPWDSAMTNAHGDGLSLDLIDADIQADNLSKFDSDATNVVKTDLGVPSSS